MFANNYLKLYKRIWVSYVPYNSVDVRTDCDGMKKATLKEILTLFQNSEKEYIIYYLRYTEVYNVDYMKHIKMNHETEFSV